MTLFEYIVENQHTQSSAAIALGIHRPTVQKYLQDRKGCYHVVMMHNGKDRLFTVRGNLIN